MLSLVVAAASVMLSTADAASIETPTEDVIQLWGMADEGCRGGYGNEAKTYADCASRDVYQAVLAARDICHGKEGQAMAEMEFHQCEAGSIRLGE